MLFGGFSHVSSRVACVEGKVKARVHSKINERP